MGEFLVPRHCTFVVRTDVYKINVYLPSIDRGKADPGFAYESEFRNSGDLQRKSKVFRHLTFWAGAKFALRT